MKTFVTFSLAAFLFAGIGCGPRPIPSLPAITATSDKDVRASIMYVYDVVGALGNVLDKASALEDTVAKSGGIPPAQDKLLRAKFVAIAQLGKKFLTDVDTKALTDWKQIQARAQPIIDEVNSLAALTKPTGPSAWATLVQVAVDIAIGILQPGAFMGGR
jgi:hypothetical protein